MSTPRPGIPAALSERYELRREIGAGGMAVVYEAWDIRQKRNVAVKLIKPELVSQALAERFEREVAIAAQLVHPNVVPVYDAGVEGQTLYFVMPLLQGGTLRDRFTKYGVLPVSEVRRLAEQIGAALQYAHSRQCIHRDVKPENILMSEGMAMLADFGIARSSEQGSGANTTGGFMGSPAYASPEQLKAAGPLSAASDQYSFACVLVEALSARAPTSARDVAGRDLPPYMLRALQRALAVQPAERFASVGEFVAAFVGDAEQPIRAAAGWSSRQRVAAVTVAVAGLAALYLASDSRRPSADDAVPTVAVLPCRNLSGDPAQEYFSDGVTEQIISQLSSLPELRVINMLSVLRLKGSTKSAREIGRELDAELLVTCSTNRQPEGVSIRAQLVDVRTDDVLWTREYMDGTQDILRPQLDAALNIAQALSVTMSDDGRQKLTTGPTLSDSAFSLYMRGRSQWNNGTLEGLNGSIGLLRQAVAIDSSYAVAWAGLADAHLSLVGRWMARSAPQFAAAEDAIARALAAKPASGEALAARGRLRHRANWNYAEARQDLNDARRVNPSAWQAWLDQAKLQSVQGRHDSAISLANTGLRLDPMNAINVLGLAEILYFARRFDEALAQTDRAIELEPTFAFNHLWRAMILIGLKRPEDAVLSAREATRLAQRHPGTLAILARAEAEAGRPDAARAILVEMDAAAANFYVPPTLVAVVHIGLGDRERAIEALARAVAERDWFISELAVHPLADAVRGDTRVQALLVQMGLERVPRPMIETSVAP